MFFMLFILFLSIPFLEVILLIKMASVLGFWPTLGIQVATAILGAALARVQGWLVWLRIKNELAAGRLPADAMMDGFLIFVAGIILITPGLISDTVGFLVLLPPTRSLIKQWLRGKFAGIVNRGPVHVIDV